MASQLTESIGEALELDLLEIQTAAGALITAPGLAQSGTQSGQSQQQPRKQDAQPTGTTGTAGAPRRRLCNPSTLRPTSFLPHYLREHEAFADDERDYDVANAVVTIRRGRQRAPRRRERSKRRLLQVMRLLGEGGANHCAPWPAHTAPVQ